MPEKNVPEKKSPAVAIAGLVVAVSGVTHFIAPQLFQSITKLAFPRNTDRHIKVSGTVETAIGVGLVVPKTRKLAAIGSLGWVAYLAANAIRNR